MYEQEIYTQYASAKFLWIMFSNLCFCLYNLHLRRSRDPFSNKHFLAFLLLIFEGALKRLGPIRLSLTRCTCTSSISSSCISSSSSSSSSSSHGENLKLFSSAIFFLATTPKAKKIIPLLSFLHFQLGTCGVVTSGMRVVQGYPSILNDLGV